MDAKVVAEPFVREPAAGSTLNVLGVTHIYKATAAETGGSFSLWEAVFPPGAGAPPHIHAREDEAFYVLSGQLTIEFEGEPAPRRPQCRRQAGARAHSERAELRPRPDVRRTGRRHGCRHAGIRQAGGHRWQIRRHHRAAHRVNGHGPDAEPTLFKSCTLLFGIARFKSSCRGRRWAALP